MLRFEPFELAVLLLPMLKPLSGGPSALRFDTVKGQVLIDSVSAPTGRLSWWFWWVSSGGWACMEAEFLGRILGKSNIGAWCFDAWGDVGDWWADEEDGQCNCSSISLSMFHVLCLRLCRELDLHSNWFSKITCLSDLVATQCHALLKCNLANDPRLAIFDVSYPDGIFEVCWLSLSAQLCFLAQSCRSPSCWFVVMQTSMQNGIHEPPQLHLDPDVGAISQSQGRVCMQMLDDLGVVLLNCIYSSHVPCEWWGLDCLKGMWVNWCNGATTG